MLGRAVEVGTNGDDGYEVSIPPPYGLDVLICSIGRWTGCNTPISRTSTRVHHLLSNLSPLRAPRDMTPTVCTVQHTPPPINHVPPTLHVRRDVCTSSAGRRWSLRGFKMAGWRALGEDERVRPATASQGGCRSSAPSQPEDEDGDGEDEKSQRAGRRG